MSGRPLSEREGGWPALIAWLLFLSFCASFWLGVAFVIWKVWQAA